MEVRRAQVEVHKVQAEAQSMISKALPRYPGASQTSGTRGNQVTSGRKTIYAPIHGLVLLDLLSVAVLIHMQKLHKHVERCWPYACIRFAHRAVLKITPSG